MLRNALIATVAASTLMLAGCKDFTGLTSLLPVATQSVVNPVTPDRFYKAENAVTVAIAGLNAYKRQCVAGTIGQGCVATIRGIQVYTQQMQARLPELRRFVRANDQVNAIQAFQEIFKLYEDAKAVAPAGVIPAVETN